MRSREPRWARFAQAAVGNGGPSPPTSRREQLRGWLGERVSDVRSRLEEAHGKQADTVVRHRPDARLLPAVGGTWITAAVTISRPEDQLAGPSLLLLGAVLLAGAGVSWRRAVHSRRHRDGVRDKGVWTTSGASVFLATACILAVLLAVFLRQQALAASPIATGVDMTLTLEVATAPRLLDSGPGPPMVMFDAIVLQAAAEGQLLTGTLPIRVLAKPSWEMLHRGDTAVTAGRIAPAQAGEDVAGVLRPSTDPLQVTAAMGGSQAAVAVIRSSWSATVNSVWEPFSSDVAGLLPGMVMGDRSALDNSLEESMKTAGLTHLTAVSGANCTLVLAFFMLLLRSVRTPRTVSVTVAIAGLAGFVMVVGPEPSVVRAAVMGGIGTLAILGGRPKRVGSLLAVAIVVMLLNDPWLAVDYAFILSVLATLGLHLVGQRCVKWLSVFVPLWLAQAVAIPLAAQLFCSPVVILLQARLTPYTIPANMLAAPVIALVTAAGTLGMALAAVLPPLAAFCAAASGVGAWWVAVVARFMAALPAASVPWPDGVEGMILMAVLNMVLLCGLVAVVERHRAGAVMERLLGHVPAKWRLRFGFGSVAAAGAAAAAWWTAAVLRQ